MATDRDHKDILADFDREVSEYTNVSISASLLELRLSKVNSPECRNSTYTHSVSSRYTIIFRN